MAFFGYFIILKAHTLELNFPQENNRRRKYIMLNLLIVEDSERQITLYQDAIVEFNKSSNIKIEIKISSNLKEGFEQIRDNSFDAAIIDLRLDNSEIEGKGQELVKEIKNNLRFPVFVLTGFPGDLDEDLKKENVFYRVYNSTEKDTIEVLKEMTDIYKTGITKIMGSKGIIEKMLLEIFWENISENMEYWKTEIADGANIEKILSRHILAHLSEKLTITEEGEFEKCHPAEVYLVPPIKKDPFTGDILKKKDPEEYFLILTPACDMDLRKQENNSVKRNADKIILAKLIRFDRMPEICEYIGEQSKNNEKEVKKYIMNKKGRYHYLPSFGSRIPGFIIDFQDINQINPAELDTFDRVASIDEPFLKNIISRFTSYYARQGSPDLDIDIILKRLIDD
jgi:ActR/RegA family two-component response regulator